MELVVLDASVATKWLVVEPDSAVANDLLTDSVQLTAPAIVRVEVAGAILRRHRMGVMEQQDARAACERWNDLLDERFVRLIEEDEVYGLALDLALRTKHPLPDCLYLAAAMMLDCRLLTADQILRERGLAVNPRIDLLARAA